MELVGTRDIEGKAMMGNAEQSGKRTSLKSVVENICEVFW
jgi:hypothetical protein